MKFTDSIEIAGTRKRDDGYLVVDARVARTGVQRYLGVEVGKPDLDFVDVYRPESEVFADEAMASFAHRPVTDDHPTVAVTSDNWKELSVGSTADEVARDKKFLRVPLMVSDGATIAKVESGKRELSAGYTCDLKFEKGTTSDGQTYDAIQTNIRANHVAIVAAGRAGKECRIGDNKTLTWGIAPITTADRKEANMPDNLRNVMVDGLSVQTTDQGAQAIDKLIADRDAANDKLAQQTKDHNDAIKAKDAELAKKDAELDDAKGKVLDQAAIDKLVADRATLEATALKIDKDIKPNGMSDADLRKAVVQSKLGDDAIKDKPEAYIDARFDILAEDAGKTDQFRDTMKGGAVQTGSNDAIAERQKAFNDLMHYDQTGQEVGVQ